MAHARARKTWSRPASTLVEALRRGASLEGEAVGALLEAVREDLPPAAWHPTGFIVLGLHDDERGALRLHLWPAGAREQGQPCWPVHDHVWDLRSHVLCGTVESRRYAVSDDEAGDSQLYAVEYGEGRSSCMRRSERRVSVRGLAPRKLAAGERYEVPAGAFHASCVCAGELAATLVATRPTERRWPWVVGGLDAAEVVQVERSVANDEQVSEALGDLSVGLGMAPRS